MDKNTTVRFKNPYGGHELDILAAMFLDGRNRDEICRKSGVNRAHLRVLLCRAKKPLRNRMARDLRRPVSRSRAACAKRSVAGFSCAAGNYNAASLRGFTF